MVREASAADDPHGPVAYLLVRDGANWRDVFRLSPGQVTTVGRAPTNRVVLRDEVCSRNHCEIFETSAGWTLRDLDSRNGTKVNGSRITGDWELEDGEVVQIGATELGFTFDLSTSFAQFAGGDLDDTATHERAAVGVASDEVEPEILHRARRSRYRSVHPSEGVGRDRVSRELAGLYRMALDMGAAPDARQLSEVVLNGLFDSTNADIGAVLLLREPAVADANPMDLRILAYRAQDDLPYQRVSNFLSQSVLRNREAVLARDISDDANLLERDSLDEISAKSVICAPVRLVENIFGLVHLYSTNGEKPVTPDDLEFTLAVADQLAVALDNLRKRESLASGLAKVTDENKKLRRQLQTESELIGDSLPMNRLREQIERIAASDATVLVRGESGVGKELVARGIHFGSRRKDAPFVCMNCAALTESLLESELFGHEKGSFTGATGRKSGKFEQADGGTLFLDEVGEMSLPVQAKFLRVLEGHPFERVGGREAVRVDVRVVAATNRDLEEAVGEKTFRQDLYFRLHVVEIRVDPLRERRDDIPVLAEYFLQRFATKANRPVKRLTPDAVAALTAYDWPGNVRELQNTVERADILTAGSTIASTDINVSGLSGIGLSGRATSSAQPAAYREVSLHQLEREHILATLDNTDWNKSKAAQILGIERSTLDRKLKRYDVSRPAS